MMGRVSELSPHSAARMEMYTSRSVGRRRSICPVLRPDRAVQAGTCALISVQTGLKCICKHAFVCLCTGGHICP